MNWDQIDTEEFQIRRQMFLDDWATTVQPSFEDGRAYQQYSVAYGTTALQAFYFLHGGALAALPTLLTSLTSANIATIAHAAIPFVVGIISTAISSLAAYLNFQWQAQVEYLDAGTQSKKLSAFYSKQADADVLSTNEKKKARYQRRVSISFYVGVTAALVALIAFVWGSYSFIEIAQLMPIKTK